MTKHSGLGKCDPIAFVTIVDVERAKKFYRDALGLRLVSEQLPFALEFDANGVMLRVAIAKQVTPASGTVLGWSVPDISVMVRELSATGVVFERFDGMGQDELGIWVSPSGAKVAWFKDPDGNLLSLTEFPASKK